MTPFELRIQKANATLKAHPTLLLDLPHPDRRRAADGFKARSKAVWLLEHAGAAGRTRACKMIEEALRRRQEPDMLPAQVRTDAKP